MAPFLKPSIYSAPRQCLLLPHHPSLAPLLEESGLLGEVHLFKTCHGTLLWAMMKSDLHPTPRCITIKRIVHDSLYVRVIVNVIFYIGGHFIVLYSCCFTESVIYIYIHIYELQLKIILAKLETPWHQAILEGVRRSAKVQCSEGFRC